MAFNWGYTDNGHRIVLTGGYLSPEGVNDDNTHGLGNHAALNSNSVEDTTYRHEISFIQDCPASSCRSVRIQGTDHGTGPHLKSGPVYGNYAIYISDDSKTAARTTTLPGCCCYGQRRRRKHTSRVNYRPTKSRHQEERTSSTSPRLQSFVFFWEQGVSHVSIPAPSSC